MPNITRQQAINRWDKLPMILREAMFSERNADILWGVCETQHLSEDKIRKIAALAGNILLGFIHPEDLAKEIKDAVGINSEIAEIIAKEIDRKIFTPIRSEVDKAYALSFTAEEEIEESEIISEPSGPVMADIVKPEIKITKPKLAAVEPLKIITTEEGEKIVLPGAGIEAIEETPAPALASVTEIPTAEVPAEAPVMLHKEAEGIKPVFGAKKSLGDLFGHLLGRQSKISAEEPEKKEFISAAQIETQPEAAPGSEQSFTGAAIAVEPAKSEARVVHYEPALRTPITETGEPVPTPVENLISELKEAQPPALSEKPKEPTSNAEELIKAKVVNIKADENKQDIQLKSKFNLREFFNFRKKKEQEEKSPDYETISKKEEKEEKVEEKKSFFSKMLSFIKKDTKDEKLEIKNEERKNIKDDGLEIKDEKQKDIVQEHNPSVMEIKLESKPEAVLEAPLAEKLEEKSSDAKVEQKENFFKKNFEKLIKLFKKKSV